MAKNVLVYLADGFEEIEAIATIDLLRRAGLSVRTIAVGTSTREVSGAHHIPVLADDCIGNGGVSIDEIDAIVLPGGLPGVTHLNASEQLRAIVSQMYNAGKLVAAICAAPSILGGLGILEGKEATCYPSFEETLTGYTPTSAPVVISGNVITARSAGVTFDFAEAIITHLLGREAADAVASAIIRQ